MAKRGRKPKNLTSLIETPTLTETIEETTPTEVTEESTKPEEKKRRPRKGKEDITQPEENGLEDLLPVKTQEVAFPYILSLTIDDTHVFHNQQTSFQINDIFGLKIENIDKDKYTGNLTLWFSLVRLIGS